MRTTRIIPPSIIPPSIRPVTRQRSIGAYTPNDAVNVAFRVAQVASVGASAYHGYKRNESIGWALVWGFFGGLAPVVTPAIALAQGFGKRKVG